MINNEEKLQIDKLLSLAKEAGDEILKVYNDPVYFSTVDYKADDSPLTLADKASHMVIENGLKELYPDIPIISEEGDQLVYEDRRDFDHFYWWTP